LSVLALAALPLLGALVLWGFVELENFLLFGVLFITIIPVSLAKPGGANVAAVDILLILAGLSWLANQARQRGPSRLEPRRSPILGPGLLFVAVSAASLAWSIKPRSTLVFTLQLAEFTLIIPTLFAALPTSVLRIRRAFGFLIAGTTILSIVTLIVFASHPSGQGTYLPGWNKNAIGSYAAAGAVLAYCMLIGSGENRHKRLLTLAVLLNVGGVIAAVSRGAIIGGGIAFLIASLLLGRRRFMTLAVIAVGAVLSVAVLGPLAGQKTQVSGGYDSSKVRTYAWRGAIVKIRQNPFLGTGGKTYSDVLTKVDNLPISDPDNMFLLTWSELGIPGMVAIIFLLYRFERLFGRVRRLEREDAVLAIGAGSVALSFFVHFQFDVTWTRGTTSLAFAMIGLMVAITRLAEERELQGRAKSASLEAPVTESVGEPPRVPRPAPARA
jgi:O-antigen ligase